MKDMIAVATLGLTVMANLISIGIFIGKLKAMQVMIDFRFNNLEKKQDKYNNLQERMIIVEQSAKSFHHRLDQIEDKKED